MRASVVLVLLGLVTFGATRHTQPDCLLSVGSGFGTGTHVAVTRVAGSTGVRLVRGCFDQRSGGLQFNVFNAGWRSVCYETFDYFDAQFACNFLAFPFVESIYEITSPTQPLGFEYDCTADDLATNITRVDACSSYGSVDNCSSYAGIVCDNSHPSSEGYVALVTYNYGAKFDLIAPADGLYIENCNIGYSVCHGVYFASKNNTNINMLVNTLSAGPSLEGATQHCGDHGLISKFGVTCSPVPGDPVLTRLGDSNTIWTEGLVWSYEFYDEQFEWLNVCGDGMGYLEAQLLCNTIGFPYFSYLRSVNRNPQTMAVIESIECTGYEQRLAECDVHIINYTEPLCHDLATVGCAGSLQESINDSWVLVFEPVGVANLTAALTVISPTLGLYLTNCSIVIQELDRSRYCPGVHLVAGNNTALQMIYFDPSQCEGIEYQLLNIQCGDSVTPPNFSATPSMEIVTTDSITNMATTGRQTDEEVPPHGNSSTMVVSLSVSAVLLFLVIAVAGLVASYIIYKRVRRERSYKAQIAIIKDIEERNSSISSTNGASRYVQIRRNHAPITRKMSSAPQFSMKNEQWEIPFGCISLGKELGSGAYGVIRKGVIDCCHQDESIDVAVKLLKKYATESERQSLLQEIDFMKDVGYHRHVISMLACCTAGNTIALVMEFMPFGDLQTHLKKCRNTEEEPYTFASTAIGNPYALANGGRPPVDSSVNDTELPDKCDNENKTSLLSVTEQLQFGRQIALGMEYLAGMKVVHRDLATRNVLIDREMFLKVSDFGLSRDIYSNDAYHMAHNRDRLPVRWMSIESIMDREFSVASDVWSFGVVLWEIATCASFPYCHMTNSEVIDQVKDGYRLPQPESCSDEMYDIMLKCWQKNPSQRPSFADLRTKLDALLDKGEYTRLM